VAHTDAVRRPGSAEPGALAASHSPDRPTWSDDPDAVRPTVLIVGGFLTSPPLYRRLAARLRDRGAADVMVAPVWLPDWLLMTRRGLGPIATRAGRSLLRAGEMAAASTDSAGAPVLVVGHSAGGIVARLLTSPEPFDGRRLGAAGRIGAIVTLGSPHLVSPHGDIGGRVARAAAGTADRAIPGAFFAPRVGYLCVAASGVEGRLDGDGRARSAHRFYRGLLGPASVGRVSIAGDGVVPVESALIDGWQPIVLADTVHSQLAGAPWYGSEERLDGWWPAALGAWHAALRARVEKAVPGPDAGAARLAAHRAVATDPERREDGQDHDHPDQRDEDGLLGRQGVTGERVRVAPQLP